MVQDDLRFVSDVLSEEWDKKEILNNELETLGELISGNISDMFEGFFTGSGVQFRNLKKMADKCPVRVEAVVESVSESKIQKEGKNKGNVFCRCILIDRNKETATMTIWSEMWKTMRGRDLTGKPICCVCRTNFYKGANGLILERLEKVGE